MSHAKLSPSGFSRWGKSTGCRASIRQSEGFPNGSSQAAYDGSAEHFVSAKCFESGVSPEVFMGKSVVFYSQVDSPNDEDEAFADEVKRDSVIINCEVTLDQDAVDRVATYVNYVSEITALSDGKLYVEQKLPIDHITGEEGATGTGDALVFTSDTLYVIDYKSGMVKVDAYDVVKPAVVDLITGEQLEPPVVEPNGQLAMYAHGALRKFDLLGDIKYVKMAIVQPRIKHLSEVSMTVNELNSFIDKVKVAAIEVRSPDAPFNPSADNCQYCAGRMTCKAREQLVLNAAIEDFATVDTVAKVRSIDDRNIGELFELLPLIRKWCDDVEERTLLALDNGKVVTRADGTRYKLVTGKRGIRKWVDEAAVLAAMKEMNLPDSVIYSRSLITPTVAERLSGERKRRNSDVEPDKAPIGPLKWKRLSEFITQAEGKPEVALESDPRPSRKAIDLNDFNDVVDLFN